MIQQSLQEKILKTAQYNMSGAGIIANKFAPSISQKLNGRRPGNVQILPEQNGSVTARVPEGTPVVPMDLSPGRGVAHAFTMVIDCSAVGSGTGSGQTTFVIFDHSKYHQKRNAISSAIPAGSISVEGTANNIYDCIVNDTCSDVFHFYGISVRASAVSTATITPEQQVNQNITMHRHNADGSDSRPLRMNQYYDPQQFDRTKQIVPLMGEFSRVDKRTAWVYKVYNGLSVEIDFFILANTKD